MSNFQHGELNSRLNKLSDDIGLISGVQGGFRKGYSVQDSLFVMHSLISLYLSSGKKLYCDFVDFKKAFDIVWRIGLWQKLIKNKIGGKMFRVILNLFTDIKSCVKNGGLHSHLFTCETGVRQAKRYLPFYLPCI